VNEKILSPQFVRTLQISLLALAAGVVMFGVVTFIILLIGKSADGSPIFASAGTLTVAHAIVAVALFPASFLAFNVMLSRNVKPGALQARIQAAYILRAAFWEGAAIFGLVILIVTGKPALAETPVYWANLISSLICLTLMALTFPTRIRLEQLIRTLGPA
jgi:F0F1-type ATP synthase membrane subunit c/vacuolar-type H+-ATPase subunit K